MVTVTSSSDWTQSGRFEGRVEDSSGSHAEYRGWKNSSGEEIWVPYSDNPTPGQNYEAYAWPDTDAQFKSQNPDKFNGVESINYSGLEAPGQVVINAPNQDAMAQRVANNRNEPVISETGTTFFPEGQSVAFAAETSEPLSSPAEQSFVGGFVPQDKEGLYVNLDDVNPNPQGIFTDPYRRNGFDIKDNSEIITGTGDVLKLNTSKPYSNPKDSGVGGWEFQNNTPFTPDASVVGKPASANSGFGGVVNVAGGSFGNAAPVMGKSLVSNFLFDQKYVDEYSKVMGTSAAQKSQFDEKIKNMSDGSWDVKLYSTGGNERVSEPIHQVGTLSIPKPTSFGNALGIVGEEVKKGVYTGIEDIYKFSYGSKAGLVNEPLKTAVEFGSAALTVGLLTGGKFGLQAADVKLQSMGKISPQTSAAVGSVLSGAENAALVLWAGYEGKRAVMAAKEGGAGGLGEFTTTELAPQILGGVFGAATVGGFAGNFLPRPSAETTSFKQIGKGNEPPLPGNSAPAEKFGINEFINKDVTVTTTGVTSPAYKQWKTNPDITVSKIKNQITVTEKLPMSYAEYKAFSGSPIESKPVMIENPELADIPAGPERTEFAKSYLIPKEVPSGEVLPSTGRFSSDELTGLGKNGFVVTEVKPGSSPEESTFYATKTTKSSFVGEPTESQAIFRIGDLSTGLEPPVTFPGVKVLPKVFSDTPAGQAEGMWDDAVMLAIASGEKGLSVPDMPSPEIEGVSSSKNFFGVVEDAVVDNGGMFYGSVTTAKGGQLPGYEPSNEEFFTMYHGTSKANVPLIMSEGLKPGEDVGKIYSSTFFSDNIEVAKGFAGKEGQVIRADIPKTFLDKNSEVIPITLGDAAGTNDIIIQGKVPSNYLSLDLTNPSYVDYGKVGMDFGDGVFTKGFARPKVGDIDVEFQRKTVEAINPVVKGIASKSNAKGENLVATEENTIENALTGDKVFEAKSGMNQASLGLNDEAPIGFGGFKIDFTKRVPFGRSEATTAGTQAIAKTVAANMFSPGKLPGETKSFSEVGILGKQRENEPRGLKDRAGQLQQLQGIANIKMRSWNPYERARGKVLFDMSKKRFSSFSPEQQGDIKLKLQSMINEPSKLDLEVVPKSKGFENAGKVKGLVSGLSGNSLKGVTSIFGLSTGRKSPVGSAFSTNPLSIGSKTLPSEVKGLSAAKSPSPSSYSLRSLFSEYSGSPSSSPSRSPSPSHSTSPSPSPSPEFSGIPGTGFPFGGGGAGSSSNGRIRSRKKKFGYVPDFTALMLGQVSSRQRTSGKFNELERRYIPKELVGKIFEI